MSGIFITYRRDDSQGFAGRLEDDLTDRFGDELIFRDREIEPGEDFAHRLRETLDSVDVAIAVIGRSWADARDSEGNRRLDKPDDWVRVELETALERDIPVIPVLVADAEIPSPEHLPASLAEFSRRQAFPLSDLRWGDELDELATQLAKLSPALRKAWHKRGGKPAANDVAAAIRDVGDRVIEEAMRGRRSTRRLPARGSGFARSLYRSISGTVRSTVGLAVVLAVVYVGIRIAGGPEANQMLDRVVGNVTSFVRSLLAS